VRRERAKAGCFSWLSGRFETGFLPPCLADPKVVRLVVRPADGEVSGERHHPAVAEFLRETDHGKHSEPKLFQAVVVIQWSLKGSGGEELLENTTTSGGSVTKGSLDDFASNKEFLNKAFREASTEAAALLGNILRAKVQKVEA
jgi:hypothetical protein